MNPQIIVVDDDPMILKRAWSVLTDEGMKVVVLKSGSLLLEHMKDNPAPDLILLDISMPEMDGFDVLDALRKSNLPGRDTPVIFLTANEDEAVETRGLSLGAMDFIRKPFIANILALRVSHAVELVRLKRNLENEVTEKTKENEKLFLHVVSSLADAIDAKDAYTKGHSGRVAEYSREIARRYGYSEKQLNNLFMMGLLHDVGKIGVPDEVINKPGRLTDEEFAWIKKHPVIGGRILANIEEMPSLAAGAKWHHERYDGRGYPEGLVGKDIPEEARIIAVADAYDAMTTNRSYRGSLPQEKVRGEIEKGKGAQFDPVFADIMLTMIDEDKDYTMRDLPKDGGNRHGFNNILLVDDDITFLKMAKKWLMDSYNVTVVKSGMQAIEYITAHKPDLILMDYEMPIITGSKLMEMLRSDPKNADIPVIFLTGQSDEETIAQVMSLEPQGYLLKTMNREEIVKAIDEFFQSNK